MSNQEWNEVGGGESWKPENAGDVIQGVYVTKETEVGPNNSNIYSLRTKDGVVGVWGSAVIDTKFKQLQIGQEVRVEFLGLGKAAPGKKPYKDFKVLAKPVQFKEVDTHTEDTSQELDLDEINY